MDFIEWERAVHPDIKNDSLWKVQGYKLALYLAELSWHDSQVILKLKYFSLAEQLYRSSGSISANISEGYSRISNKEKARYYEIALGSAREVRGWYHKSRYILTDEISPNRIRLITKIIKLLLCMISDRRRAQLN